MRASTTPQPRRPTPAPCSTTTTRAGFGDDPDTIGLDESVDDTPAVPADPGTLLNNAERRRHG